jgi:hypothetical protein
MTLVEELAPEATEIHPDQGAHDAETQTPEPLDHAVSQIVRGEPSDKDMQRQIQLMAEACVREHPGTTKETITKDQLDATAVRLATENGARWSKAYRGLISHPDFVSHARFQGHISNVTLDDVEHFADTNALPVN